LRKWMRHKRKQDFMECSNYGNCKRYPKLRAVKEFKQTILDIIQLTKPLNKAYAHLIVCSNLYL
jgi:hypothetical protein